MKIGIWDGCANGGMMDSMSMSPYVGGNEKPYAIADIPEEIWHNWQVFLKEHDKWERYWDQLLIAKENRNR